MLVVETRSDATDAHADSRNTYVLRGAPVSDPRAEDVPWRPRVCRMFARLEGALLGTPSSALCLRKSSNTCQPPSIYSLDSAEAGAKVVYQTAKSRKDTEIPSLTSGTGRL